MFKHTVGRLTSAQFIVHLLSHALQRSKDFWKQPYVSHLYIKPNSNSDIYPNKALLQDQSAFALIIKEASTATSKDWWDYFLLVHFVLVLDNILADRCVSLIYKEKDVLN